MAAMVSWWLQARDGRRCGGPARCTRGGGPAVCVAGSLWWTAKRWWLAVVAVFLTVSNVN
ncbi:hypothetical protein DEO72_LG11g1766 [Vigna unguiculata]|uniref:Uncharacterized protein n=1 Tax=Vigna unguiculata TaxID=3917 RepID=A0A4D6NP93_VIGUN|nr:hypothetical protein DEO72_LG11g1766 [Vigna unguiculata]